MTLGKGEGRSVLLEAEETHSPAYAQSAQLSSRDLGQLPFPESVRLLRWLSLKPHSELHCISLPRRML